MPGTEVGGIHMKRTVFAVHVLACAVGVTLWAPAPALAWKPAGHWVTAEKAAAALPADSRIRIAMEKYPNISFGWGAYGHDVGYGQLKTMWSDYAEWADLFHYHKAGSFAKEMLRQALASRDEQQIAYAAGWLTHATGDMAGHSMYVNDEAGGVFFDNGSSIPKHKELEKYSDPYIWTQLGGHPASELNTTGFGGRFHFDLPIGVRNLFAQSYANVYSVSPSRARDGEGGPTADDFNYMTDIVYTGLSNSLIAGQADLYAPFAEAVGYMGAAQPNGRSRADNCTAAVNQGAKWATDLFLCAEAGNYAAFQDCWNLDIGWGDQGLTNALVVEMTTGVGSTDWGTDWGGTDENVIFWLHNSSADPAQGREWLFDHSGYNDFEENDRDYYYCYVHPDDPYLSTWSLVGKTGVHVTSYVPGNDDWLVGRMRIWCNGVLVEDQTANTWLWPASGHDWWSYDVPVSWDTKVRPVAYIQIDVPDLVGQTETSARRSIPAAGLAVGAVSHENSTAASGTILWQSPRHATRPPLTPIDLRVSKGPRQVLVPDLYRKTEAEAAQALVAAQLVKGSVTTRSSRSVPRGRVISQVPAGGTTVVQGTTVRLAISSGRLLPLATLYTPVVPRLVTRNRSFTVYRFLKPRHPSGTYAVKLHCYRFESGAYRLRKTVRAKVSNYSTYSRYAAKLSLPSSGRWRIRAYHSDGGHRPSYSGYRYLTAR